MMARQFVPQKLRNKLTQWFMVVAIPPVLLVSLLGYVNVKSSLQEAIRSELEATASSNKALIENWFYYRDKDVESLAHSYEVAQLLQDLSLDFKASQKPLKDYTQSFSWHQATFEHATNIHQFLANYDYIYDIFLIDRHANILYSLAHESDLGTNLRTGPYANTRFAQAVDYTLQSGETRYSDLERYAPSNDLISSFFTAAIVGEQGNRAGVFAVQVRIDRVLDALAKGDKQHYLVGTDGLLRSVVPNLSKQRKKTGKNKSRNSSVEYTSMQDMVLNKKIQLQAMDENTAAHKEDAVGASVYRGPFGYDVVGIQNSIQVLNVRWVLVSEVDEKLAFSAVYWLRNSLLVILLLSIAGIAIFTFSITRKITTPIRSLSEAAKLAARGNLDQSFQVDSDDEISDLANALQIMLDTRRNYEAKLKSHNKTLEQTMFELEEQRAALAHHAIVAITDLEGTVTYANQKLADISGYALEDIVGKSHWFLTSGNHSRKFFDELYQCIESGHVWQGVMRNRHKDGSVYWISGTVVPVKNIDGSIKHYISIFTDITEQKNTQLALERESERAEAANKAKSDFLACMSHEIRTPMNGVLGMLGLLRRTKLTPEQARKAEIADTSAKSLLTIINDILDFSKIDAGKLTLENIDFELTPLFSEIADAYAFKAEEKGLELILDTHKIDCPRVIGDPTRVRQIVTNLLGNALKFTEKGEVIIRVLSQPVAAGQPEEDRVAIVIEVEDSGIGIPDDKKADLFAAFTQADTSTTRQYGGTGLGLSIVRQLCDLMDGHVAVTSKLGSGSCFRCEIILAKGCMQTPLMPVVDLSGKRVLIVDDNAVNLSIFAEQLKMKDIQVVCASSAEEAIHYLQQASNTESNTTNGALFDAAIIDFQMPNTNGAMLGMALKKDERWQDIPLVMMTSQGSPGDAAQMASYGFSGFFSKPTPSTVLYSALAIIFENGPVLASATPLLTHDFVTSLTHKQAETPKDTDNDGAIDFSDLNILLVEDNPVNQELVSFLLADTQANLIIANHGQEALDLLNADNTTFNVILMDCQMPVLDGFATSQAIRKGQAGERYKATPILAMTANAMKEDRERCINAGMDDYMSKPIDEDLLIKMLKHWGRSTAKTSSVEQSVEITPSSSEAFKAWDYEAMLKRVGNKPERLVKLIGLYLDNEKSIMDDLEKCISLQAYDKASECCHTLRGVAGNMGGDALAECSQKLEKACKNGDAVAIATCYKEVLAAKKMLEKFLIEYQSK